MSVSDDDEEEESLVKEQLRQDQTDHDSPGKECIWQIEKIFVAWIWVYPALVLSFFLCPVLFGILMFLPRGSLLMS